MHWRPEHVNPMLALRLALLNGRWSEFWQEHQRLRQHQQQLKRQTRQQQRLLEQQATRQQAHSPPPPAPSTPKLTRQKTGRTQAQYRWGRHTFSPRMLKQASGAKNETHPGAAIPRRATARVPTPLYLSGVGFFESKRTSKEERGNRRGEDVSFW
jgi:hypothetical protein